MYIIVDYHSTVNFVYVLWTPEGFLKKFYFKTAHKDSVCTYVSIEMKVTNRFFNKMVRRFEGLVFHKLIIING